MTATAKPNSISCACHSSGATPTPSVRSPKNNATHSGAARQANAAAPR